MVGGQDLLRIPELAFQARDLPLELGEPLLDGLALENLALFFLRNRLPVSRSLALFLKLGQIQ